MKILFISTMQGFPWGGSEELWSAVAAAAIAKDYQVMISLQQWPELPDKIKSLQSLGAKIVRHPFLSNSLGAIIKRKLKQRFSNSIPTRYEELIAFIPDIICLSQGSAFDIVFSEEYKKVLNDLKKPYNIIIQHNVESGFALHFSQIKQAQQIFNSAANLFFVAARNLEVMERQLAVKLHNAKVVANPVNLAKKKMIEWPSGETLRMACVARYDIAFKGQDILLQALSANGWRNRDFSLQLFGAGPDENYLRELIIFYNLQQKVTVSGHSKDIRSVWKNHHVLILPSLSEGTPLSLIEANLCGRPALGTDTGDIGKYIIPGKTGFIATAATPSQLSIPLEQMWDHRSQLKEMGEQAYHFTNSVIDHNPADTLLAYLTSGYQ